MSLGACALDVVERIKGGMERLKMSYEPSTLWAQGGPIIERENIWIMGPIGKRTDWSAACGESTDQQAGHTPLIAAMRAFVASKLGEEVEVPE